MISLGGVNVRKRAPSPTPVPDSESGAASAFFTTREPRKQSEKAARRAERIAQKKKKQQKAQEENDARQEAEAKVSRPAKHEDEGYFTDLASIEKNSYWNKLLRHQNKDVSRYGEDYLTLTTELQTFKTCTDDSAPFPTFKNFGCAKTGCLKGETIGCCHHDLEKVLRGSGQFSEKWLKKERHQWHPDKFPGTCERMVGARERAGEVFKLCQKLLDG